MYYIADFPYVPFCSISVHRLCNHEVTSASPWITVITHQRRFQMAIQRRSRCSSGRTVRSEGALTTLSTLAQPGRLSMPFTRTVGPCPTQNESRYVAKVRWGPSEARSPAQPVAVLDSS